MIRRCVIVGGGTAGWMTAAALSKHLRGQVEITLVESDEIGIIGVGEATIPHIATFNAMLGVDEDEFLRETRGTFKLGIEFVDWLAPGERYIHGFGKLGPELDGLPFHHFWLRAQALGESVPLADCSINTVAPRAAKFMRPERGMQNSPLSEIVHAYHFDAGLYARFLRGRSERQGVQRIEGKIVEVRQQEDGAIAGVVLEDGRCVEGDFFVDCSGMRALLIEQTLKTGYEDWSRWLMCDRAVAVPSEAVEPLLPITRATARPAGWQWRIPLQHRIGNGHVYSSRFMDQAEATAILLKGLDGAPLAEPRHVTYVPGRRRKVWSRNCVAIGLAAGFFEPIESTNIHLIQTAIFRLMNLFPRGADSAAEADEANRQARIEYERVRDFIVLHYKATRRDDSPFWRQCRDMDIPDSLQHKIDLYRSSARFFRDDNELFGELSWVQVMEGQGIHAQGHHPFVLLRPADEVLAFVRNTRDVIARCVDVMPSHADYIAAHCAAPNLNSR
ncbi:tryptophan halogenase family protein [Roseateles sp.]|uniref:tryptophan halogenase family protein n=1 Tax=Roseateles sp. TaxID=1971397 RepID=UPI002E08E963|nr:tryptophan halogenase family protein [Roseateles sp.]